MKRLLLLLTLWCNYTIAQTVTVGGLCINPSITLAAAGTVNGKPAYTGTGTVAGFPNVAVSIYWLGPPDNLWVLAFDGQPFFSNSLNSGVPPSTFATTPWTVVTPGCTGASPLSITGSGVLPVRLLYFTATPGNKKIQLAWKTENEVDNKGFEIERSTDLNAWSTLDFVPAKHHGTGGEYHYTDINPLMGYAYYRLRQIDIDGKSAYSAIERAFIAPDKPYTLSQNSGSGILRLTTTLPGKELRLRVVDLQGRQIMSKKVITSSGIDITGENGGVYLLEIYDGTFRYTEKIIKW